MRRRPFRDQRTLAAMALGLGLGRLIPGLDDALSKVEIGGISLPIVFGL